jgi:hypothetical protein
VAIETLARAATVRMSGLLGTVVRLPFRLTDEMLLGFVSILKILIAKGSVGELRVWQHRKRRNGKTDPRKS